MLNKEDFIEKFGSGTLQKSYKMGLKCHDHFIDEWLAFYVGYEFEALPETRITTGHVISEGDCKAITELLWFNQVANERLKLMAEGLGLKPPKVEPRYINIEYAPGDKLEGIGLVFTEKGFLLKYISDSKMVFAITCKCNSMGEYENSKSPF